MRMKTLYRGKMKRMISRLQSLIATIDCIGYSSLMWIINKWKVLVWADLHSVGIYDKETWV